MKHDLMIIGNDNAHHDQKACNGRGRISGPAETCTVGIAAALVMARMLSKQLWFTKRGYTFDGMAKTVSGYYN